MKVISIVNQKGGVAKTTTSLNIGLALSKYSDKKILLIDLDPQGNLSKTLIKEDFSQRNLYHLMTSKITIDESIFKSEFDNLSVIPADQNLSGATVELINAISRETILSKALESIKDQFDLVIIDCPPSLNILTINALSASDEYIIPMQAEGYAVEGVAQIINVVQLINNNLNPNLSLRTIVLTMYDKRNKLHRNIENLLSEHFQDKLSKNKIPKNIDIADASTNKKSIFEYKPKSKGAKAYTLLTVELFPEIKGNICPIQEVLND